MISMTISIIIVQIAKRKSTTKSTAKEDPEIELVEFFSYYGYVGVKLSLNLSESNSNNDGATKVPPFSLLSLSQLRFLSYVYS